jgi:hypothetical protein
MKIPTAFTAIFLAAINFVGAQNTGANAVASPLSEGDNVTAAGWDHYHRPTTGGAVFYPGRYSSVVAMSANRFGLYKNWHEAVPRGGGTDYFQDQEGN